MTTVKNNDTRVRLTNKKDKIAIVGVACRFPGGIVSLEDYWRVLSQGQDVVTEIPSTRFGTEFYQHPDRKEAGKSVTFAAGVLDHVDQFDAGFFGISPREAEQMDPQQRLLLELTWEALENGGQVPEKLAGSDCAVYIGIASTDYLNRRVEDPASLDAYTMTGNTASIASNRISYLFDLQGPSVSVDTACSSSLVAVHHACQALRTGEASMAIAGGVNMLLHPFAFVGFSKASMLSARGRCRTFDAGGDGYVRAEGAAVLFLKPLEQAEADGDPIHAVIVASGINADGRTNGMTVPSDQQQAKLLRKLYDQAHINLNELVYLEAHGTGTAIGDPIETRAIGEALAQFRSKDKPLLIGSAKTNLGHLETASGMAGLLKALLTLRYQAIPPSLHIEHFNEAIHFDELNLRVVTEYTPLAATQERQLIGINSFGFGGANAHVIIEHYAANKETSAPSTVEEPSICPPLFLSARHDAALQALAQAYAQRLDDETVDVYDVAFAALKQRQHLTEGLLIQAPDRLQLQTALRAFAQSASNPYCETGRLLEKETPLVWVFSGNGSQWQGMGQVLMQANPLFRQAIAEVDHLFTQYADYSLLDEFAASVEQSRLHLTEVAQPLLFAMQVAMVRVLQAAGAKVYATLGHSVGEVAAAWAAGALTLEQAVQVIYERSQAQGKTRGQGRMAAISLSPAELEQRLQTLDLQDSIELAGINSPQAVTVSGKLTDLESLKAVLDEEGVFCRILDLDYAFHSHWMEPTRDELLAALQDLQPSETQGIRFISSVYGKALQGSALNANYWWENIRKPVAFADAINVLLDEGARVFMEIGPHAILRAYMTDCLRAKEQEGLVLATGKRKEQDHCLQKALHQAILAGCTLDWSQYFPKPGRFVALPNYPWQRESYWYPLSTEGYDLVNRQRVHPLLGYRLKEAEALWENQLDSVKLPWLADHVVDGAVIVPGAAYIEMALTAASIWYQTDTQALENLEIRAPVMLESGQSKTIRFNLHTEDGKFTISSRTRLSDEAWTINVIGRITSPVWKTQADMSPPDLAVLQQTATEQLSAQQHYALTEAVGLTYLPAFQGVDTVWVKQQTAWAKLAMPAVLQADASQYALHPALLDAGFQVLVAIFRESIRQGELTALIPIQLGKLNYFAGVLHSVYVVVHKQSPRSVLADFLFLDERGQVVAELINVRFRGMQFIRQQLDPAVYQFVAVPKPLALDEQQTPALTYTALFAAANDLLQTQASSLQREQHFQQIVPLFEALASAFAWEAISPWFAGQSQALSLETVQQQQAITAEQMPLLRQLMYWLAEDGLAEQSETGCWSLAENAQWPPARDIWLAILGDSAAHVPELTLLGRSGLHLPAILRGELSAEAILAPAKSSIHGHWLDSAPSFRALNLAIAEMLRALLAQWPKQRRLRILELGDGDAALTHLLLPLLPSERCEYVLADAHQRLLLQVRDEFADYLFFNTVELDDSSTGEGWHSLSQQAPFDLIIVGNALYDWRHASSRLPELRRLLKAQGHLWLAQAQDGRFLSLTQGLSPDWWVTLDNGTETSCLLKAVEWQQLLSEQSFMTTQTWFEPADEYQTGAFLILAQADQHCMANPPSLDAVAAGEAMIPERWLILADAAGYSAELAEQLRGKLLAAGQQVRLQVAAEWSDGFDHVIHLAGLQDKALASAEFMALQDRRCVDMVRLVQQIDRSGVQAHLWLITANALRSNQGILPEQAPLWGVGRVLANEHPDLPCTLIDLQNISNIQYAAQQLVQECLHNEGEDEVLLSAAGRQVLRLQQTQLTTVQQETQPPAVCLDFTSPGPLKHLYWRALPEQALQADEIEICPRATGLNFRDVMYAMGLLSDEAVENGFAGASLGMELSGVVVRTGTAVKNFQVGDAVIGFAPACFSTRVITRTTAVAHKPKDWSDEAAATVPTTFFTVYYALHHLAQLQPGERILIHGASGGVGLAAIQFARYRGAEIFATAGTDEKREFVQLMGADYVLDSRSLRFAEDIMRLTQGEGIDVVLNSISGEAINRNLDVLRPFGRFLELGKRDFYENSRIGLRPFRNNISYFGIDADQLLIERPALAGQLFGEMMALFDQGVLRPLPYRVFPANRVREAFRYMQQSRQIGKVVVSFSGQTPKPTLNESVFEPLQLDANASYLVTGGLSGFGLRTAQWLAEKGAGTLILLGRSGASTAEAKQAIAKLEAEGVQLKVYACDVADYHALRAVFADIEAHLPPLKGLVHAAMVLDDGIIRNLTAEQFHQVLAPKMLGAQHLHELTLQKSLDFFVMYSSVTTYLGNAGQANYVAANMFLESLAQSRRQQGLAAVYAAWGAIADAGYLSRKEAVLDALQSKLGGEALTAERALSMLEKLIQTDLSGAAIVDFDWSTIQRFMPSAKVSPKFTEQRHYATAGNEDGQSEDIHALIADLDEQAAHDLICDLLLAEVGQILRLPLEKLSADKSVFDLGMDSLMGMELVMAIEVRFGVRLPVMALTEGATVSRIANKIAVQLLPQDSSEQDAHDEHRKSIEEVVKKHGSDLSAEALSQLAESLAGDGDPKD